MRVLLLSLNYAPEPTGIAVYSSGLAQTLAGLGHDVSVVCANPHFPQWKLFDGFKALGWTSHEEAGVALTRCPVFVPAKPSGLARIAHYLSFLGSAAWPMLRTARSKRPDVVVCVAPSLISAPLALAAARISGAHSWLHVQDFEVEAALVTDNMQEGGIAARLAFRFEQSMIRAFGRVSSISPEMCRKLIEKGRVAEDVYELRNWAEIDQIKPQLTSQYRDLWDIRTPHVALYSGSIARKQGIETIVDAARLLRDRDDLTFVICGNGPTRAALESHAAGLANVRFYDLQPLSQLGELLNLATVHLLPQRAGAADLVLPSKLANMLASGRPVVAGVHQGHGLAREVEGAGLICVPEDAAAMAGAVARLLDDPHLYAACSREAVLRAHSAWSRRTIIGRFEQELIEFVAMKSGDALQSDDEAERVALALPQDGSV